MRLRRSRPDKPGYGRRRRGKAFSYHDQHGQPITDEAELTRLRGLVIPPAWRDVWISPYPNGHIQATGVDAAGRRQYLYHAQWRVERDAAKFDHVIEVAGRLPTLRQRVNHDLGRAGLVRDRVLAATVRLLDLGLFRVGGDEYAEGEEPTYGVATLRPEHLVTQRGWVRFEYPAKGGLERSQVITDPQVCAVLRMLRRRRPGADRLFAYWARPQWREVHSGDVNDYLKEVSGVEMTAKDFRTWHATVLAAVELAGAGPQSSAAGRRRAVVAAMQEVSELLGNTPTVARNSYVDPRVIDLFEDGVVLDVSCDGFPPTAQVERSVLRLLSQ